MIFKDSTVFERKIFATFDENDIRAVLTKHLAKKVGFNIDPRATLIEVRKEGRTKFA